MTDMRTYRIKHYGNVYFATGVVGAARWLVDTYGLPAHQLQQLVERIEASPVLENVDLGLRVELYQPAAPAALVQQAKGVARTAQAMQHGTRLQDTWRGML